MSSLEFLAKNVDKAIEKACDELNLAPDKIKYDILSHGSSGIFGLAGVKKAKIRVHLPEISKEPVSDTLTTEPKPEPAGEISVNNIVQNESFTELSDEDKPKDAVSDENLLELGRTVLQRIVDSIAAEATISAEEKSEGLFFNVVCENAGILIGKKGQTLDAIQLLVEKIVNKSNSHKEKIRVQIDVEGYLETRKANLEKLAERLAHKSKKIRKPISLGQMSAYDRRIVHLALKDDPEIRTKSRGEGYMRKLVIFPQKNSRQKQQSRS